MELRRMNRAGWAANYALEVDFEGYERVCGVFEIISKHIIDNRLNFSKFVHKFFYSFAANLN